MIIIKQTDLMRCYNYCEPIEPKEGDFFGMLFDEYYGIYTIEPNINIDKKSETNSFEYNYVLNKQLAKNILDIKTFPLPIILKKLEGNLAQDILTGIVFYILSEEDFNYKNKILSESKEFQNKQDLFRKNPLVLSPSYTKLSLIDDNFKFVYYNLISDKKNEVIEKLNSLKLSAQQNFDEKITEGVDIAQAVAETDNLIYVYKQKNQNKTF